jgi:hypothetical protein
MRKLWRRVTAKVANTRGLLIHLLGELRGRYPRLLACLQAVVPILAKEAIKRAGVVKNSQVFVAVFGSLSISKMGVAGPGPPGADPIGDAVSGQGIIIPANVPLLGAGTNESALHILAQATVAFSALTNKALIDAKVALLSPFISGGRRWQIEGVSRLEVCLLDIGQSGFKIGTDTIRAKLKGLGDKK